MLRTVPVPAVVDGGRDDRYGNWRRRLREQGSVLLYRSNVS
jgi:hypothetical protein